MAIATPLNPVHEHFLPNLTTTALPAPWSTIAGNAVVTVQLVQNTSTEPMQASTGTALGPLTLAPGDSLLAWASSTHRHVYRIPYRGVRLLEAKIVTAGIAGFVMGSPSGHGLTVAAGDVLAGFVGLRGECSGASTGTARVTLNGYGEFTGLPQSAEVEGVAQQPSGDAAGNLGASVGGIIHVPGDLPTFGLGFGTSGPCGLQVLNETSWLLLHIASEPLDLGVVPALDAPVTLHMGESLNGVFADPSIDVTYFQNVDLDVGSVNTIGDQLSGGPWYRFAVRDRSRSRGLVSYTGETLLTRLSRMRPRESLILVAGDGGVPNPLTLQECLRRFLTFYGVPFKEPLPPFFLRTSTGIVTPTAQAFVIQPDQENPESVFDWLELFFGPFRGYTWRADADDELVVKPPAWAEATGLRFHLYRSSPVQQRSDLTYPWPWPGRAPTVEYRLTVEGETVTGTIGPLEAGVAEELIEGVLEFELTWAGDGETLQVERTAPFGFAPVFDAVFIAKPAADDVEGELELTVDDLTPDETESSTADSVYTQAIIPVRERTFQADQPLMQPAAIVLKSPEQLAAGAFGANVPFGPMEWAPESPEGFLELVNDDAQAGTWFWPVDPGAVPQPGGAVTVEYEVEEWAEQWRGNLASAHEAAYQANTYSDSVTVDTNGVEVKVLDFEFPAQTSGFPGSFTARGSLFARWRSGDEPGIELTVRNGRFVEWGFLWEGIGGQTVYFLWGVVVKLNGTGVVWTVGDLQVARFGFSRNADGTWEGGANVPGLAEAQRLFPNRVFHSPELPYQVDPATALSIARAVVEENHVPKVVYQLPLAPAREQGWAYHPRHLGGAVDVPALGVKGRVTAHDYTESHSPGGSSSALVVDVEVAQAMPNTPAAPTGRKFGRAVYGVTTYQPTEEE